MKNFVISLQIKSSCSSFKVINDGNHKPLLEISKATLYLLSGSL